jgi:hypothetical protein
MLTAKIIAIDGSETVQEIRSVELRPARESPTGSRYIMIWGIGEEPHSKNVFSGTVFVMNENGKTIADYFLGDREPTPAMEEINKV